MPAPLDPAKRQAIAQAIRDGGKRNEIARQFEVSPSTVTLIAQQDGIEDAFDRTTMKRATEARQADLAERRAELARLLMDDAHRLRAQLWQPCTVYKFGGKDNTLNSVDLPEPDFEGKRNLMTTVGIAVDKIGVLTRDDSQGVAAVDAWLRSLGVGATS
jgi:transposase-like protein